MALPLPTLTWTQGAGISTGYLAPTEQQVIDAVDTALASATYWEKKSEAAGYIEIGPKAGSAIPNFKAIICGAPGAAAVLAPDTDGAALWVGIAPSGGTLGTWNSATPYGASRWSKYWKCCTTAVCESLYLLETNESLMIVFRDNSLDNFYACLIGAVFTPPDAGSAESDDRVYGMITSGTTAIAPTFWNSQTSFLGHSALNNQSHMGIFRPDLPTSFETIIRFNKTVQVDTSYTPESLGGSLLNTPVFLSKTAAPYFMVGKLRQMYITKQYTDRTAIYNSGSVLQGYAFSPAGTGTANAVFLSNN